METVVVANLLGESVARRRADPLDCAGGAPLHNFLLLELLGSLGPPSCPWLVRTGRVVLRRSQVHLVLVRAARLDHAWWLAHDLLVWHARTMFAR